MEYVFEDNRKSMLSRFFEESYGEEMRKHFHYTRGNSNIKSYVENNIKHSSIVCIFLDLSPGNPSLVDTYESTKELVDGFSKLIVIPIVSREYCYLKSLTGTHMVTDQNRVADYLNFNMLNDLDSLDSSYEKLGKVLCKECIKQCGRIGTLSESEDRYRPYFVEDCACKTNLVNGECSNESLISKSSRFVSSFPAFPVGSNVLGKIPVAWDEAVELHRSLIKQYNSLVERQLAKGTADTTKYRKVKAMY